MMPAKTLLHKNYLQNLNEIQCKMCRVAKKWVYFSFDFSWYFIHPDIVRQEQGWWGGRFCLTNKIF